MSGLDSRTLGRTSYIFPFWNILSAVWCIYSMWWLILNVSLTRLRDSQRADETLFLGLSVRVSPEEISVCVSRLNKEDCPPQLAWVLSSSLRAWMKQRQRRVDLFSVRAETPIFCPRASAFLVLGPLKRKIVKSLNCVRLFATAPQAPPSMEFSRQEYCSGFPSPSPGDLPDPGIEPGSPTLQADALPSEPPGKQGPLKSYWIIPPALLVLQFAENRSWDFSFSLILWDNSNSTSLYSCIYATGSVSLEISGEYTAQMQLVWLILHLSYSKSVLGLTLSFNNLCTYLSQ